MTDARPEAPRLTPHICGDPNAACDQECAVRFYEAQERRQATVTPKQRQLLELWAEEYYKLGNDPNVAPDLSEESRYWKLVFADALSALLAEVDALRAALATLTAERDEAIEHRRSEQAVAENLSGWCQRHVEERDREKARAEAAESREAEAREIARKAMGLTVEEVADVETVGLVGSLASHLELAEQEIDNRGRREAEAQQRIARLETALDWMVHLHHGVGKAGTAPSDDEWRDAITSAKAALAASPTGIPR